MNPVPLFLIIVTLPLLLGGCGSDNNKPVAENKPIEEMPINPNLKYETEGDAVTITFCDRKASGALTIPATIEGNPVTSIGDRAFSGCESLTDITIPDGVTSIGENAFSGCDNLTTIEVGAGNMNFTGVNGVLFNADKTVLVSYPAGKTGSNYNIPDSVTSIGKGSFGGNSSLTSITIHDSVTSIGEWALAGCTSLTNIKVATNNSNYRDEAGVLFNKENSILYQFPLGKSENNYTIPEGVTSIGGGAFAYCANLTRITIPDSVTSIGKSAFGGCSALTRITIPDGVTSIEDSTFFNCNSLTSVTIPDGVTSIGIGAFLGCDKLTNITIGNSITSIGHEVFAKCSSLTAVTFLGDAPKFDTINYKKEAYYSIVYFGANLKVVIYRKPEAKGWGDTWAGRPVKLISEKP